MNDDEEFIDTVENGDITSVEGTNNFCNNELDDINDINIDKNPNPISNFDNHNFKWRSLEPPQIDSEFCGNKFSVLPFHVDAMTSLSYFQLFGKDEKSTLIADQINLYSFKKSSTSVNTSSGEIDQLIGIQMLRCIVNLLAYHMYWLIEKRYPRQYFASK